MFTKVIVPSIGSLTSLMLCEWVVLNLNGDLVCSGKSSIIVPIPAAYIALLGRNCWDKTNVELT